MTTTTEPRALTGTEIAQGLRELADAYEQGLIPAGARQNPDLDLMVGEHVADMAIVTQVAAMTGGQVFTCLADQGCTISSTDLHFGPPVGHHPGSVTFRVHHKSAPAEADAA
jgi:hypothetical protein